MIAIVLNKQINELLITSFQLISYLLNYACLYSFEELVN